MSAWVSPPQESVVQAVAVAAIMAQAASTALPPRSKILAPAAAAIGLPVTAIQCCPYSAGFWVFFRLPMRLPHRPAREHMADFAAAHASRPRVRAFVGGTDGDAGLGERALRLSGEIGARHRAIARARGSKG